MNHHQRCLQPKVKNQIEPKQVMPKSQDLSESLEWTFDTEFPTIFNTTYTYIIFKSAIALYYFPHHLEFRYIGMRVTNQYTKSNQLISKTIGILNRLKFYLPLNAKHAIYHSLILSHINEEQIISGYPIDGAISVRVDGGFGSNRWFVYITTLLL